MYIFNVSFTINYKMDPVRLWEKLLVVTILPKYSEVFMVNLIFQKDSFYKRRPNSSLTNNQ